MKEIRRKLKEYYVKLYGLKLLRGFIIAFGLGLALLMALVILEYFLWLPSQSRSVMWFSFLGIVGLSFLILVAPPLFNLLGLKRSLKPEKLAELIGKEMPVVDDKLLNLLELERLDKTDAALVKAAIDQKAEALSIYDFKEVLQWKKALRWWPALALPVLTYLMLWISGNAEVFTTGSERLLNYKVAYEKALPFTYKIKGNTVLEEGEDLHLEVLLKGEFMPGEIFAETPFGKRRLLREESGKWALELENMQEDMVLGLSSRKYDIGEVKITVQPVPKAGDIIQEIVPPTYTGIKPITQSFQRRVEVPVGSSMRWKVNAYNADSIVMIKGKKDLIFDEGRMEIKKLMEAVNYKLYGFLGVVKKELTTKASVEIMEDQYPKVKANYSQSENQKNVLYVEGTGNDDYGLRRVAVILQGKGKDTVLREMRLQGDKFQRAWTIDLAPFAQGDDISVVVAVWDNDEINGSKKSLSSVYTPRVLTPEEMERQKDSVYKDYQRAQENVVKEADKIKKELKAAMRSLADDNNLSWEEKEKLAQYIENYKKRLNQLEEKKTELKREEKKEEELKELLQKSGEAKEMEKLLEEIKDLLNKEDMKELQKKLDELNKKNGSLERNVSSEEELLKEMKYQRDVLREMDRLEKMSKKAEELSRKMQEEGNAKPKAQEDKEIEEIQKEMDKHGKKMEELENYRDPLGKKEKKKYQEEKSKAEENLSKAKQSEKGGNPKSGSDEMKESGENMQKMKQQMQNSLMDMQMKMQQENLEALRAILENLEVYSHGVEEMGERTKELDQADPGFRDVLLEKKKLELGQKVIEDSLKALAERAPEIKAKVFEEVGEMKKRLAKSIEHLQETEFGKSAGNDQFSMMAANNLAVMLDASMQQMQMNLAAMMKSNANCNKPGGGKPGGGKPSEQQGKIGKKIEKLKKGKQPGEGVTKELMQIMREQEQLRQEIAKQEAKDGNEKKNGKPGGSGNKGDLSKKMEEIEKELAKGNLDFEYKERIQRIKTRLLEDEEAKRKQGQKEERKAERVAGLKQEGIKENDPKAYWRTMEEEILRKSLRLKNFYY